MWLFPYSTWFVNKSIRIMSKIKCQYQGIVLIISYTLIYRINPFDSWCTHTYGCGDRVCVDKGCSVGRSMHWGRVESSTAFPYLNIHIDYDTSQ